MAPLQAELRSYFATLVVVATLPDAAELNAKLSRIILERERQDQGVQHSNLGGWQSSWDFEAWGGPPAKRVLDAARELATRLTSDRAGKAVRINWKINAWANINRRNQGNEFHTHPGPTGRAPTTSTTAASARMLRSAASSRCRTRGA
jgi:hypothetical protein